MLATRKSDQGVPLLRRFVSRVKSCSCIGVLTIISRVEGSALRAQLGFDDSRLNVDNVNVRILRREKVHKLEICSFGDAVARESCPRFNVSQRCRNVQHYGALGCMGDKNLQGVQRGDHVELETLHVVFRSLMDDAANFREEPSIRNQDVDVSDR